MNTSTTPALKTVSELRAEYTRNRVDAIELCAKHGVLLTTAAFNAVARGHLKANRYFSDASRWSIAAHAALVTFEGIEEGYYEETCDMDNAADVARAKASFLAAYARLAASV